MPSWHLFAAQDQTYRESVLPTEITARVSVEAGATLGWERWLGALGIAVGIDCFGASAPWSTLYTEFGLTTQRVVESAREAMGS
jgi:transketolase